MKHLCFALSLFAAGMAHAEWTMDKPKTATVVAFDDSCVQLKGRDGKTFKVTRQSMKDYKLVAMKTEIQYFDQSVQKHLCAQGDTKK